MSLERFLSVSLKRRIISSLYPISLKVNAYLEWTHERPTKGGRSHSPSLPTSSGMAFFSRLGSLSKTRTKYRFANCPTCTQAKEYHACGRMNIAKLEQSSITGFNKLRQRDARAKSPIGMSSECFFSGKIAHDNPDDESRNLFENWVTDPTEFEILTTQHIS
jgi:hypothetical protein